MIYTIPPMPWTFLRSLLASNKNISYKITPEYMWKHIINNLFHDMWHGFIDISSFSNEASGWKREYCEYQKKVEIQSEV